MEEEHSAKKGTVAADAYSEDAVLPLEMFYEILPRLPLKKLLQFKCVCKEWRSAIRNPSVALNFMAHHAQDRRSPTALISFVKSNAEGWLFFSLDLVSGHTRPIHSLNEPLFSKAVISESLNGLICFEIADITYICNLTTGQLMALPAVHPDFPATTSFSSLGFDEEKRQHKIMRTWSSMFLDDFGELEICGKILKLGTGSWRSVASCLIEFRFGGSVFLNGTVHYLTLDINCKKTVIAFDVGSEKFREMPLPDAAASSGRKSKLVLFKGHLAMLDFEHFEAENSLMIYKLIDYHKQLWEEQKLVLPWHGRIARGDALAFHITTISTGEIMMTPKFTFLHPFALLYNTDTNEVRRLGIVGLPDQLLSSPFIVESAPVEYVESIFSFDQPL